MNKKRVHVAVGVIEDGRGAIFISRRHAAQHQAGKWEFPGGKVEAGEGVEQALARELFEELGIQVTRCQPLMEIEHDYSDKQVRLDVWRVTGFVGEPWGKEGQTALWVPVSELAGYEFPEANTPIMQRIVELYSKPLLEVR